MDIKINTIISNDVKEITINVVAPNSSDELHKIVNNIILATNYKNEILATKNNQIFILKIKDIAYFYSNEKYIYCKCNNDSYIVKEKLYELEADLPCDKFIRISNSCIINIDKLKYFDVAQIGSLVAIMEDNSKQDVSKRRIKEVMKFLNERR